MRFYNQAHAFYCGVDLHARTMYLCIFNHAGQKMLHKEVPSDPAALLEALAPYRAGLVVACECCSPGLARRSLRPRRHRLRARPRSLPQGHSRDFEALTQAKSSCKSAAP